MYVLDNVYRSLVHFTQTIAPSGVVVSDGASFGIRMDDPTGQSPSIAVTLGDVTETSLELGSQGLSFPAIFTIHAKSRLQRDAIKYIIYSGLVSNQVGIYTAFSGFVPLSSVAGYFGQDGYIKMSDMPNFDSDREKFFWSAVVYVTLSALI